MFNQTTIVEVGDNVEKGMCLPMVLLLIAVNLRSGRNLLVAFMPWDGYNFEDSILIQ